MTNDRTSLRTKGEVTRPRLPKAPEPVNRHHSYFRVSAGLAEAAASDLRQAQSTVESLKERLERLQALEKDVLEKIKQRKTRKAHVPVGDRQRPRPQPARPIPTRTEGF